MELNEQQKAAVKEWAGQGAGLAEIQRRLRDEMGVSMTYMDVRFLALELGLKIRDRKEQGPERKPAPEAGAGDFEGGAGAYQGGEDEQDMAPPARPGKGGSVSVSVDRVVKPGSLVSGTVRFSDGVSGSWFLDRLGQLALQTAKQGYKPSGSDLHAFQSELRKALERSGF